MAKNDYHVIVYRILLYLYACLKGGEDVDPRGSTGSPSPPARTSGTGTTSRAACSTTVSSPAR